MRKTNYYNYAAILRIWAIWLHIRIVNLCWCINILTPFSSKAAKGLLMLLTNLLTCSKCLVISVARTMSMMACRSVRYSFLNRPEGGNTGWVQMWWVCYALWSRAQWMGCIVEAPPIRGDRCIWRAPDWDWKSHLGKTPVKDMQQQTGTACRHNRLDNPLSNAFLLFGVFMRVGHYYENKAVHFWFLATKVVVQWFNSS